MTLVYELSQNKHLTTRLSFTLKKREASPSPSKESVKRTAKIFTYDPKEYNTTVLLRNNWQRWDEQPSSFFLQFQGHQSIKLEDPQYRVIFACLQLEQSDAHSSILRRFYCVVLHRLRTNQPKNEDAKTIAQSLYDALHPSHSRTQQEALEGLINSVESLVQAGSRYDNIAKKLGIGSLFLLGHDIGRSV